MYHFIVNPHSKTGHAKELWQELAKILRDHDIFYQVYFTKGPGHAKHITQKICEENKGRIDLVIVGGDGTANEVINGITNYPDVVLGYIPLGSSNDLARGLKLPTDPKQALSHIIHPVTIRSVDHGTVSCEDGTSARFAVSSGIGYDAAICNEALTSPLKKVLNKLHIGKLTYFLIGIKQVFLTKPTEADIIIDGKQYMHTKSLKFVASHIQKYEGGGLPMAPGAVDDDQKLTCCIVSDMPALKTLLLMYTIFKGKHTKHKGVRIVDCTTISITTKDPKVVHTDGEIIGFHNHLELSCYKDQIRMIV